VVTSLGVSPKPFVVTPENWTGTIVYVKYPFGTSRISPKKGDTRCQSDEHFPQGYFTYTPQFKAQVVLEELIGVKDKAEICREYRLRPRVFSRWREEFLERAPEIFATQPSRGDEQERIAEPWPGDARTGWNGWWGD